MARIEVLCFGATAAVEARLRRVATELGISVGTGPARPGIYVSPTLPTVLAMARGLVIAQAVGDLPLWELRGLLAAALRSERGSD